jgi:flagellar hook-associated protein 3 FlgL
VNIRVTGQTQSANAIAYMQKQAAAAAKYQDQISSGLKVKAASDDPVNYTSLLQAKSAIERFDAYAQTVSDATTDLNAGVDALGEANQVLVRARQIAIEGADGATDFAGFEALAVEVDSLIERMMTAANSRVDGKYLFGGTATSTPPFRVGTVDAQGRPATFAYDGSADRARVLVGPGETVDTKYVGSDVFQQPGGDVFRSLIDLRNTLRDTSLTSGAKSQALSQRLGEVDAAREALSNTVGEQSSRLASLEAMKNRIGDLKLASTERATDLEAADIAEAIVRLQEQKTSLEATMAVTAQLLQPSLLDFLR